MFLIYVFIHFFGSMWLISKKKKRKKKKIKSETSNSTKKKYTKEFYNIIIKKDLYVIEEKRAKRIKYFKIKNS